MLLHQCLVLSQLCGRLKYEPQPGWRASSATGSSKGCPLTLILSLGIWWGAAAGQLVETTSGPSSRQTPSTSAVDLVIRPSITFIGLVAYLFNDSISSSLHSKQNKKGQLWLTNPRDIIIIIIIIQGFMSTYKKLEQQTLQLHYITLRCGYGFQ